MSQTTRRKAVLLALLVTFLWSTSWVLIKIGLTDIPALTFAGLRYSLAFICLLPAVMRGELWQVVRRLSRGQWFLLAIYGLVYYAIVQGAQFLALAYLPAASASLVLTFTSIVVALMSIAWLSEHPGVIGWVGVTLSVAGGLIFFYPLSIPTQQIIGIGVATVGMLANAGSVVLGRYINASQGIPAVVVTWISMGVGSLALLAAGILVQGMPPISLKGWGMIAWLAVVNTAIAFTLWNSALRTLPAVEASIINNSMLVQIALLAWIFLGEVPTLIQWAGMALVSLGTFLAQVRLRK